MFDVRLPEGQSEQLRHAAGNLVVEMPVVVLGPGVEAPVGEANLALARFGRRSGRSRASRLRSVGQHVKANPIEIARRLAPEFPQRAFLRLRVIDQDVHALARREQADDLRVDPRNRLEFSRPVFGIVRPGQPGGLVRLPLGGHAVAEFARCCLRSAIEMHCYFASPSADQLYARDRESAA